MANSEAGTTWSTRVEEKVLVVLIWMVYEAAPATSPQSNDSSWPTGMRAPLAGVRRVGAGRGAVGKGLTVKVAVRVTPAAVALSRASKSLRDLRVAEVVKLDLQLDAKGKVEAYRAKLNVSFKFEGS